MSDEDDEIILSELDDDELVQQMHDDLYDGLKEEIEEATRILLDRGWTPYDILTKALVAGMTIEERIYRLRCVERWSMVIPWNGFELADLLNMAGVQSGAKYVAFETYLKRFWFSNGIHHHYSNDKITPGFTPDYLKYLLSETDTELSGEPFEVIFNEADSKKVNKKKGVDNVAASAVNFYDPDITSEEVAAYYASVDKGPAERPVEAGLNSKLVREGGGLKEAVYKVDGLYGPALEEVVKWLELAVGVAENEQQARTLELLIEYYRTGDLGVWDEYAISWVNTTGGDIDWIQGFIEVYNDPVGYKGSYESIIQIKDFEMSRQMSVLSENAQWFEDQSPLMEEHKKDNVVGISYKTIIVAGEAGDASPSTPIGVNLPNNNWIRVEHGSKSVSLGNIVDAYNKAGGTDRLR